MRGKLAALGGAAAALAIALPACGGSGDAGEPPRTLAIHAASPQTTFAPLLRLHARESYWPMSADYFLDNASLEWSGGPCWFEVNISSGKVARPLAGEPVPLLEPRRLGHEPAYRHRPRFASCSEVDRRPVVYTTTQHTRLYDRADRPAGLYPDEGFHLDLLTESYNGDPEHKPKPGEAVSGVPVYYAREELGEGRQTRLRISYWLLFGYGRGKSDAIDGLADREGDWDRIDVVLDPEGRNRYIPLRVRYWWPKGVRTVDWADVERSGPGDTHPVAYLAPVSHTPRPAPLRRERGSRTPWRTWELLRDARRQPWYGYGGGWGSQGKSSNGTGPLGPSPFDLATERNVKAVERDLPSGL